MGNLLSRWLFVTTVLLLLLRRCDATSPYIHPVGWCQDNDRILTTPPGDILTPVNHYCHYLSCRYQDIVCNDD